MWIGSRTGRQPFRPVAVTITFETARNENEAVKYYFIAPDGDDVQHTVARFYILPMTSDINNLDLPDIVRQFLEKIDGFSGQNSGWSIAQTTYLRLLGPISTAGGRYLNPDGEIYSGEEGRSEHSVS